MRATVLVAACSASLLAIILAAEAQVGQPVLVRRPMTPMPPPSFVGRNATLPFVLVDGIPVVTVSIGGRSFRFAVDTGAGGHGRIRASVAEALGLAVTGRMRAGDSSGATQERRTFALPRLGVGRVSFGGVQLSEMAAPPGRLDGVDGILGLGLFEPYVLTLDYAAHRLTLSQRRLPVSAYKYEISPGGIAVRLSAGPLIFPARIDTGNSVAALMVPRAVADQLRGSSTPQVVARAATAMSVMEISEVAVDRPVVLNGAPLPIAAIRFPALSEVANLGSPAFAGAVLVIDQASGRLSLTYPPPPATAVNAVRKRERAWLDAYERADATAMADILADGFVITFPDGRRDDRAKTLAQVARGRGGVRFRTENVGATGDSTQITLRGTVITEHQSRLTRQTYIDVWRNAGGKWRVASSTLSAAGDAATSSLSSP